MRASSLHGLRTKWQGQSNSLVIATDIFSSSVVDLWQTTRQLLGSQIEKYSDDSWCEEYTADEYFAFILSWGPLKEPARKSVWINLYKVIKGKRLTELAAGVVRFPLEWQNDFFSRLVA